MKPFGRSNPVLFIRLRLLGDIIFTIPAIELFKRHNPDALLYYVVEEKFREIAALIPGIDRLLVIPRKMGIRKMWQFRKELRGCGVGTVVDFHSGPKSAQLTRLSGAPLRVGYRTPNRNWAYNRLVPRQIDDTPGHSVPNQVRLLHALGIDTTAEDPPPYPTIPIDENAVSAPVRRVLREMGLGDGDGNGGNGDNAPAPQKAVVLHVGAGNPFREWGKDNLSRLIGRLGGDGLRVFLVGHGAVECAVAGELAARYPDSVTDFSGALTVADLLYLIGASAVYVGADSGPLHLASLTATPLVGLYGPNIPGVSGPWRKQNTTIIQQGLDCRPCDQRKCIHGDTIPCMKNIRVDHVYEAIRKYVDTDVKHVG